MLRVRVITDSTSDIPAEWARRHDIRVVPTYVQFGAESLADDGVQLSRADFYQRLARSRVSPTTSSGPPGEALEVMRAALSEADHVIGVTAASALSGIYNTFRVAAEQSDAARVTLIDSRSTTMGLGWQAILAAEMAEQGVPPAEIKQRVEALQPRVFVWAALDTLEYVRRSGRVGWAAALAGDFFRIRQIISLHDGVVGAAVRVRTSQRALEALAQMARDAAPLSRLAVMHTANPEGAQRLLAAVASVHPPHESIVVEATPVLGVHVGPQALGLAVIRA